MKLLKNKFLIGAVCILLGLLFGFVALPALNRSQNTEVTAVRLTQAVEAGTQITADMVETVTVPESVVENSIHDPALAIGQYAATDLYAGDYLTTVKLASSLGGGSVLSAGEAKGKVVVSVTLPSLASGVSGQLQPGDVVTVMVVSQTTDTESLGVEVGTTGTTESGTYIDPLLEYMEVCMVTASDGSEAVVSSAPEEDTKNTLPVTVSFYATTEQALRLAELTQKGTIYLAFVARGEAVTNYVPDSVLAERGTN